MLSDNIGILMKKALLGFEQHANEELKSFDLTFAQYTVLKLMFGRSEKTVRIKDIQDEFGISHPTALGITKHLEDKGYVSSCRNPEDGRSRIVMLTDKALDCEADLAALTASLQEWLLRNLSGAEVVNLRGLLQKMLEPKEA